MAQLASSLQASRPSTSVSGPRPGGRPLDPQQPSGHSPRSGWGSPAPSPGQQQQSHLPLVAMSSGGPPRLPPPVFTPSTSGSAGPWGPGGGARRAGFSPTAGGGAGVMFQDLLAATRKSMAAGMGEWDLQSLDWGHSEFREHLLKVRVSHSILLGCPCLWMVWNPVRIRMNLCCVI